MAALAPMSPRNPTQPETTHASAHAGAKRSHALHETLEGSGPGIEDPTGRVGYEAALAQIETGTKSKELLDAERDSENTDYVLHSSIGSKIYFVQMIKN